MNDWMKRGFMLGLGAAITGKEKMEEYVNDLVNKGQVAPSEMQEIMDEWVQKGEEKGSEWDQEMRNKAKSFIQELGFVTVEEAEKLKARIEALEAEQDNRPSDESEYGSHSN